MKISLRIAALVVGAVVLVGLIPDNFNARPARDEQIVVTVRNTRAAQFEFTDDPILAPAPSTPAPPAIVSAPQPPVTPAAPPSIKTDDELPETRPTVSEAPQPPRPYEALNLYLHLPPDAARRQPLRVLIVLHGVGSRGDVFSQALIEEADRNSWLLVAPTLPYRDHMDPTNLLKEDLHFSALLQDMLDNLPKKLGIKLRRHALLYGFSRGAQLAHRFAIFYPDRVESVVAISAGTYTLPFERKNTTDPTAPVLPLPYGVADVQNYLGHPLNREQLTQVSFLVEVGANDYEPDEVPRQFDAYLGKTRLARAHAFQYALTAIGIQSRLMIFPGAGHEITSEMRRAALQFLRAEELRKN